MKAKRNSGNSYTILLLRFWRVMLGEFSAAMLIGLAVDFPKDSLNLTSRIVLSILSSALYIIFDKILYERFE